MSNKLAKLEYEVNNIGHEKILLCVLLIVSLGAGCCCTKGNKHQAEALFIGREMQIIADSGRPPTKGSAGSLYDVIAASKNMSKPAGEWNHVRIGTKGRRIQITWNGEQTIDYETDRLATGYIGLQNHDAKSVVKFRNIRITEGN